MTSSRIASSMRWRSRSSMCGLRRPGSLVLRSCIGSLRGEAAGVESAAVERGRDKALKGRCSPSFALLGKSGRSVLGGSCGGRSELAVCISCGGESMTASRSITMPCLLDLVVERSGDGACTSE